MKHFDQNAASKRVRIHNRPARQERWQREKANLQERYDEEPEYWQRKNLSQIKCRAKKRGIPFDITLEDIPLPPDMICPVLGILLVLGVDKIDKSNSPSIDRINSDLGYIKGNVRVISYRANTIKSNATLMEILAVAEYIRREQDK